MRRINYIDFFRGIAIINMVIYHLLFDLVNIYGFNYSWFNETPGHIWQQFISWTFIFISGVSMCFSRNSFKRGVKLLIISLAITISTNVFMPSMSIKFGVIHFIATAILITSLVNIVLKKINVNIKNSLKNNILCMVICFAIFLIVKSDILFDISLISKLILLLKDIPGMFILGFPDREFYSADYFPILPWIFLFWSGYFLGKIVIMYSYNINKIDIRENIITKLGRNSLLIYLTHQIVIMIVLKIILS